MATHRILMVHHTRFPESRGGIDSMLHDLILGLKSQHHVAVFTPGTWEESAFSRTTALDVPIYRLRLRPLWDTRHPWRGLLGFLKDLLPTLRQLRRMIRDEGIEVIHLHTLQEYHLYFFLLRAWLGTPLLTTLHGTDALRFNTARGIRATLLKQLLRHTNAVVGVAPAVTQAIAPLLKPAALVTCIPNGIDPRSLLEPSPPEMAMPERFFLQLGDLEPVKAPDITIRAWLELLDEHPDWHLVLIGNDGDCEAGFRAQLEQLLTASQGRIHYLGRQPRPTGLAWMRRCQAVVIPSRSEGLPYVLLESGLMAKPVICSDIPAFQYVLGEDGEKTGYRVPVNDVPALAAALRQVIAHPDEARRRGDALAQRMHALFSAQKMCQGYLELYDRLKSTNPCRDKP